MQLRRLALVAGAFFAILGQASAGADAPSLFRPLILDGHQLKWGQPKLGSGARVSYAIVTGERHFPGARNCAGIKPVDTILTSNRIAASTFREELAQAFAAWQTEAGITFEQSDPESADILIGAQIMPRGRAFTNVSYNEEATTPGVRSLTKALICLNPSERWKIGFDGNLDVYDLRYTLMHEIGHAIGLNHPEVQRVLMHFSYHEKFRSLQEGDMQGAIAVYGPAAPAPMLASRPTNPLRAYHVTNWGEVAFDTRLPTEPEAPTE
jgi:hypothetical protein